MKLIEKLSAMVDEEIEDATKYAKCAVKYKDDRPALAKRFTIFPAKKCGT